MTASPLPPPRPVAARVPAAVAVVALAVLVGVWAWRLRFPSFVWEVWTDRDLARARLDAWPTHGAELSFLGEARVPGGAYAWILAVPTALSADPWHAYAFGLGLAMVGLAVTGLATRAAAGPVAGALAASAAGLMAWDWDARRTLWNPSFLPLPAAIATAAVLLGIGCGRRGMVPVAAAALAIAAQLHLSAAAYGIALAVAALATGARPRWREVAVAVAVVGALYAPWAIEQAGLGWPDLRGHGPVSPSGSVRDGVVRLARELLVGLRPVVLPVVLGALWTLPATGAGAAALLAVGGRRASPLDRALATLALATGAHLVAMAGFGGGAEPRYVVVAAPALGVLAGVGTARALARAPALAVVAVPGVLGMGATLIGSLADTDGQLHRSDLRERALAAVGEALGGGPREVAGRTVMHEISGPRPLDGNAAALAAIGETFPGSLAPPCALVVPTAVLPAGPALAEEVAARLLDPPGFGLLDVRALDDGITLVTYTTTARCRTNLSNRYVDTPAEAVARGLRGRIPCGGAARLGDDRVVAMLDAALPGAGCHAVPVVVDLERRDGAVRATLHGNALRGLAYYGGWFDEARLPEATLVLSGPSGRREAPLATGPIGWGGDLAPVSSAPLRLAPGDAVTLEGRIRLVEEGHGSDDDAKPFRIDLGLPTL